MSKTRKKQPQQPASGAQVHPDDEIVHVPKGSSPLRFIVTVGLMLFVLVIFTVGDQLVGSVRSRGADQPVMSWVHPTEGEQRYSVPEFGKAKRELDSFFYVISGQGLGRSRNADEFTAYHLIMSRLALDAGIEVPDAELSRVMSEGLPGMMQPFLNIDDYRSRLARNDLSPQQFESILREFLRVDRYEMMLGLSLSQPGPADIEAAWKEAHQEHAFDLIGLQAVDVRAEAEAEVPDEAGLREWYEGLEEADRTRLFFEHFTPVRSSAAVLSWPISLEVPIALVMRFPRAGVPGPEDLARSYYDRFKTTRFARPAETPPGDEGDQEPSPPPVSEPYTFEEVRELAMLEAPVHGALLDLVKDLNGRAAAGGELDLAAEAAAFGLTLDSDGLPRSREEWVEMAGDGVANAVASNQPGSFAPFPLVDAERMAIVQVLERQPTAAPAFDEVVEPAREAWIDERAQALVEEKLAGLSEALAAAAAPEPPGPEAPVEEPPPAVVDAETFASLAQEAGLTVVHQDWFDPARPLPDPDAQPDAESFLRSSYYPGAALFVLEEGEVSGPLRSFQDERQWLVRAAGRRDPQAVDLRPSEYERTTQQALYTELGDVLAHLKSLERLQSEYGLEFPLRSEAQEGDPDGDGPDQP